MRHHQSLPMYSICILGLVLLWCGHQVKTASIPVETTTNPTVSSVINDYKEMVRKVAENGSEAFWTELVGSNNSQITLEELLLLINKYDNGSQSRQEFLKFFAQGNPNLDVVANEVFREFDVNNDGYITESDFQVLFLKMNINGDVHLQKEEFVQYFSKVLMKLLQNYLDSMDGITTTISPILANFNETIDNEVPRLWHLMDTNKDSKFTIQDMYTIFATFDVNKDSEVTKAEFTSGFTHYFPALDLVVERFFHLIDMDNDDVIRRSDLDLYFNHIADFDFQNNGYSTEQEFKDYFKRELKLQWKFKMHELWYENHKKNFGFIDLN